MIKSVIRADNGLVAVFDENDEQIQEYQGEYEEVREKILRDAPPDVVFGRITTTIESVPREEW
jgi:hypothetical protein